MSPRTGPPSEPPMAGGSACARGGHGECPHFFGLDGGWLNLLRPQLDDAVLCQCSCHSGCPLRGTRRWSVPFKVWLNSCACPGADWVRQRFAEVGEPPSFDEVRERVERDSTARKEAFEAVRRAAAGKSRDEIRDLYVAELRARGLEPPTEAFLAATVEHIAGNPVPTMRLVAHGMAGLGKGAVALARLLRDINRPPGESRGRHR
jgi:hypothetical protein